MKNIEEAVNRGQKRRQQKSGLIEAFYSYFSIVYDEFVYQKAGIRKIYPVTVKVW